MNFRIGNGYDVHRLVPDRALVLGGVTIPFEKGLLGHSDADVLVHAIIDSLLGAAALGDIGGLFPDNDIIFKNIDSLKLLKVVFSDHLVKMGYSIGNIDSIIVAQNPKLSPFIQKMRENIAEILQCNLDQISIKATTEEKLGFTGNEEGISAHAVSLIYKN